MQGSIPGKPRLSAATRSTDALNAISRFMVDKHQRSAGNFPHHAVFVGEDTQLLANSLQFYLDGGAVDLLAGGLVVDNEFRFNQDFLMEIAEDVFDMDLSDEALDALPATHPVRIIKQALAMSIAENQGIVDPIEKTQVLRDVNQMFIDLVERIRDLNRQYVVHFDASVKSMGAQQVKITRGDEEYSIPANYFVSRRGHIVAVNTLDGPPVLNENAGLREARSQHDRMVRAEKYRTSIQRAMKNFAEKPNVDADSLAQRVMARRLQMPDDKRPKVTVVGLGPAGAFAAIRAYQEGAIVTGVEKRETYSRNNVFRFTPEIVDELIKLFVDNPEDIATLSPEHPLRKVIDSKSLTEKRSSPLGEFYAISIKDFEYLTNAWLDMMAKKDPNGIKIFRGFGYVAECIKAGKEVAITDGKTSSRIATDLLVAADGYRSQCRTDCGIEVQEMSTGVSYATLTYHPPHGTEADMFRSLLKTSPRKAMDVQKLKDMGWEMDRLPVPRYFNTGDHPYLGIEVPQPIANAWREKNEAIRVAQREGNHKLAYQLKEQRDAILDRWGKATLEMFLTPDEIKDLVFKESAIIDVKLMKAKRTSAHLPHMTVLLVGDAAQAAHFQTGRGAITGIEEANQVGLCVRGLCKGKKMPVVTKEFDRAAEKKTLALHELAFHFPTKEDLRIRPTRAFGVFKEDVNVHDLEADHRIKQAATGREAQAKAQSKFRHAKR